MTVPETRRDLAHLRILVVMPSIPLQGMERSNIQIMKMMIQHGADVLFVTHRTHGQRVQEEVRLIGARFATARVDALLLHAPRSFREAGLLLRAWIVGAFDIDQVYRAYRPTHIFLTDMLYVLYTIPTLLRSREPSIFFLPVPPDRGLRGLRGWLTRQIWCHIVSRLVTRLVANSDFTRRELEAIGVPDSKVSRIYCCLPERSGANRGDVPTIDPRRLHVIFLGRVSRAKGVRELVDAAYDILNTRDDVDFYIVGEKDWMNPFADGLIREVTTRGFASRIYFTGEIRDVMPLMAQCHVHVCPTVVEESFGQVVLEAKSLGVPSVVFPSGGLLELVRHLEDGFVCRDKSASALVDGIQYFLGSPSTRNTVGEAARASLIRFGRETISEQWVSALLALSGTPLEGEF